MAGALLPFPEAASPAWAPGPGSRSPGLSRPARPALQTAASAPPPARPPVHLTVCLSFLLCVPVLLCGSLTLDLAFPAVQRLVRDSRSPAAEGGQASHWRRRLGSWHPRAATALGTAGPVLPDTTETWAWGPCSPCLWGRRPCGSQDSSSRVPPACHRLLPERPPQLPTSQAESHTAGARQLRALTSSAQGRVGAKGVQDKKGQEVDSKFFLWLN